VGASATPKKRLRTHCALAGRNTSLSARWVYGLLEKKATPILMVLTRPTLEWEATERGFIERLREEGCDLLNATAGGTGCWGLIPGAATRTKRSITLKKRYADDPEQMAVRRSLCRSAARSDNSRLAASTRMKGIWSDPVKAEEMRKRMRGAKKRKAEQC
jgi:hypothetical protein